MCVFVSGFFLVLAREKTRYFTPRIPVKGVPVTGTPEVIYRIFDDRYRYHIFRSAGGPFVTMVIVVVVYDKVSDLLPLDSSLYFTS